MSKAFVSPSSLPPVPQGSKSLVRALAERVLDAFRPPDDRPTSASADEPVIVEEREFATEQEAEAFARSVNSLEYTTRVQQNVYDYSWSVEVHAASRRDGTASNDDHLPPATSSR